MMNCPICCGDLPIKKVRALNKQLAEGEKSLMAIASHYNVEIGHLRKHLVVCLERNESGEDADLQENQAIIKTLITQLQEDIAGGAHLNSDPETGTDGSKIVSQLIAAIRENREIIVTRQKMRTSDAVYKGLLESVVSPLITANVQICIDEARRLREDIFSLTDATPECHPRIKQVVDEALERIAERMQTEALYDIADKVKAAVENKNSPRTPTHH